MNTLKMIFSYIDTSLAKSCIFIIRIYQKTLSPDHSFWAKNNTPYCRFFPTCSNYTVEALEIHGGIKGGILGAKRICRCHPWSKGGYDPVRPPLDSQGKSSIDHHGGN